MQILGCNFFSVFIIGYPMFYFDPTYILVIAGAIICMLASANVSMTFNRYKKVRTSTGITAQEAASRILSGAGISNVRIERISGDLTDHYDPRDKVLRLSDSVYGMSSVAAVGVAAHECGHAIQDNQSYAPLRWRNSIVPVVNIGSKLCWPVIILGLILSSLNLLWVGIALFGLTLLFQVVTLPVEFDASHRALKILGSSGILYENEVKGARKVLSAAAMTYVASTVSTILQLLRLVLLFGRRDD